MKDSSLTFSIDGFNIFYHSSHSLSKERMSGVRLPLKTQQQFPLAKCGGRGQNLISICIITWIRFRFLLRPSFFIHHHLASFASSSSAVVYLFGQQDVNNAGTLKDGPRCKFILKSCCTTSDYHFRPHGLLLRL